MVVELKSGYEEVFTVTEYYDGPRQGIANFKGRPHFYDCVFSDSNDDYTDVYRLTPISRRKCRILQKKTGLFGGSGSRRFTRGKRRLNPTQRYLRTGRDMKRFEGILSSTLKTDSQNCIIQTGSFEVIGTPTVPRGVIRLLQVRWTAPPE